jgi:hypothetical protein
MAEYDPEKEGKDFANAFSKFVNNMNRTPKKVAIEHMLRDHPTLQQGMVRFFMEFMEGLSKQNGDLRNEASRDLAKKIMQIENRYLPFI